MAIILIFFFFFLLSLSISHLASARPFPPSSSSSSLHLLTSFGFPDFGSSSSNLHSIALFGDAHISSLPAVQLSGSQPLTVGSFFYSKPIRFLPPYHTHAPLSFSSSFSFSMAAKEGDGLAFVIAPHSKFNGANGPWLGLSSSSSQSVPHTVAIEFDSKMNEEVHDPNDNHVGLNIESLISLATANASDFELTLNDGNRLYAWIDYHAPVHVLEVRLSKSHNLRPWRPVLSHHVDLSSIWKDEMYVGFSSSTGDSPQKHMIYSWSFTTMDSGMHSFPVNPHAVGPYQVRSYHDHWHGRRHHRMHDDHLHWYQGISFADRMDDILRIGISVIFGALCGSAIAVSMLLVWSYLRRTLNPSNAEAAMYPILFGYQQLVPEGK